MQLHDQHDVANNHFKCTTDGAVVRVGIYGFRGNWNGTRRLRSTEVKGEKEEQSGDWMKKVDEDISEKKGSKCS